MVAKGEEGCAVQVHGQNRAQGPKCRGSLVGSKRMELKSLL